MSFVTDVLLTAGSLEKAELTVKISEIEKEITKLKHEIKEFMEDNYVEFAPKLKKDQALVREAERMIKEMKNLRLRIDEQTKLELSGSKKELKKLSESLKESNASLQLSTRLLEINECLKSVQKLKQEKKLVDAAKNLHRLHVLLSDDTLDLQSLEIYENMENELCILYASFTADLSILWQNFIIWKEQVVQNETLISLSIECDHEEIQDLFLALHFVNRLSSNLQTFAKVSLESIIKPIISCKCLVYVVNERIFNVKTVGKKKSSDYRSVLYNLKLFFIFLDQHLNLKIEEQNFFQRLQIYLLDDFSKILINDCIFHMIPNSSTELQNFNPIVNEINEFQDYLTKIEFTKDVDTLFMNKRCQEFLSRARDVMKKDLHDSVRIDPEEPCRLSDEFLDEYDLKTNRKLSEYTFQLPACRISTSTIEIMKLTREILDEACNSSDECAVRLFYTVRNIYEMYTGLVPEHHKEFLKTISQQVALFHNNCMYFAHKLLTLAHEYKARLPEILKKHNLTFADQTLVFRKVGVECFLNHLKSQSDIILEILSKSAFATIKQVPKLSQGTEKDLRQCLRQLELLKTVWLEVLPDDLYCKAIGQIANTMVEDLIIKVTACEDIPADLATELVDLLNLIVKRVPLIFPEPNAIQRYIRNWKRITELIIVLGASLVEIEHRWADSKGPLAHEFTADQVRKLIRALFQNTDRRSATLSRIK